MRQFADINPLTVAQDPRVVASIQDDRDQSNTYYFLIDQDYMILCDAYWSDYRQKWGHGQIEFPKRGLIWFMDSMKNKFFKTEAEGGLPKGKFSDVEEIEGEELKLGRAFNVGGGGGYYFATLDRTDSSGFAKEYIFTDQFLFKGGLIQIMQDLAKQIEAGVL